MKLIIVSIIYIAAMAGCASPVKYTHPAKTDQDLQRDKYSCDHQVTQYLHDGGYSQDPWVVNAEMKRCMTIDKGWKVDD